MEWQSTGGGEPVGREGVCNVESELIEIHQASHKKSARGVSPAISMILRLHPGPFIVSLSL